MGMDGDRLAKVFGSVVRELRKAKNFSQEGFADHVGLHRTYMGSVERGQSVVTLTTGMKIATGLNMNLSELLCQVEMRLAQPFTIKD